MMSAHPATQAWAEWWRKLDALKVALKKLSQRGTTHVSGKAIRESAGEAAQVYFREMRQHLVDLAIDSTQVKLIDAEMQELIELAARVNRTSTYRQSLRVLDDLRAPLESAVEIASIAANAPASKVLTPTEAAILKTLDQIVPTTALSYQQVLNDVNDSTRVSYRGTASELREVLRELLDHLAPDADVVKTGISLEHGQKGPTMKQKTVFILKARGVGETQRKTAADAASAVEGAVGSLARSVYNRGSLSTHISTTRTEVLTFKGYADAVLAELLEVHKG
jgi:DNA mismatch repair ATPase MutS